MQHHWLFRRQYFCKVWGSLFRQVIGIPVGTNCAPLLADLFLSAYESEFLYRKHARSFNLCYRYIDDLIVFNNKKYVEHSINYSSLWKPCIIREQCTLWRHSVCDHVLKQLKHWKLCFVIEHDMMSFRFQTTQKNSASLCSSVQQFENSMTSYRLQLNNARLPMF